jgi:hypothetical protein
MGTLIRKSILFIFISLAGYMLFILVWGLIFPDDLKKNLVYKQGGKGHMYDRMQEVKNVSDVDVLFIGSSLAARGFDPRVFAKHGYKTFNLGSGGQTPLQSEWLLKKYMNKLNPRFIIFEVNQYVLSRDGVEPAIDLISNHEFEWSMLPMAFTINSIKVYNTLIFSFWQKLIGFEIKGNEKNAKGVDKYIPGGFIERKVTFFSKDILNEEIEYDLNPMDYQKKALARSVDFIKSENIDYCLIQPPLTHLGFDHYEELFLDEELFKTYGKYYNFINHVDMNDSLHFFDSRHLNQNGVVVFNESVIKVILDSTDFKKVK